MLLVTVSWSLLRDPRQSLLMTVIGGLLLDWLSGGPFGAITVSMVVASAMVGWTRGAVARESLWLPLVAGAAATLVYYGVQWGLLRASGQPISWQSAYLNIAPRAALLNGIMMYPTYAMMLRMHKRTIYGRAI